MRRTTKYNIAPKTSNDNGGIGEDLPKKTKRAETLFFVKGTRD